MKNSKTDTGKSGSLVKVMEFSLVCECGKKMTELYETNRIDENGMVYFVGSCGDCEPNIKKLDVPDVIAKLRVMSIEDIKKRMELKSVAGLPIV